jgi:hypothetical protein
MEVTPFWVNEEDNMAAEAVSIIGLVDVSAESLHSFIFQVSCFRILE